MVSLMRVADCLKAMEAGVTFARCVLGPIDLRTCLGEGKRASRVA